MKKILIIIGYHENDYFFRNNYYAENLAKHNEVSILTSDRGYFFKTHSKTQPKFKTGKETYKGVQIIRQKSYFNFFAQTYFSTKKIIDQINPDIVLVYEFQQFVTFWATRYCLKKKIPVIYEHEQRDIGSSLLGKIRSYIFTIPAIKSVLHKVQHIRTVTSGSMDFLKENLKSNTSFPPHSVVTLGYNKKKYFYKSSLRNAFRKKYHLKNDDIVIGVTGKFFRAKQIETVIEAFQKSIHKVKNKKIKLFLIGKADPEYANRLEKLMEEDSLSFSHIRYIPELLSLEELNTAFNAFDYGLWTSATISYFEALGSGLKIIIPYGSASDHLKSQKIIFYGKESDAIDYRRNIISDSKVICQELSDLFVKLNQKKNAPKDTPKQPKQRIPDKQFQVEQITEKLEKTMNKILSKK